MTQTGSGLEGPNLEKFRRDLEYFVEVLWYFPKNPEYSDK
jgi:hypothetical protein